TLASGFRYETLEAARPAFVKDALRATFDGVSLRTIAERVLEIAAGGLDRRARRDAHGRTERALLEPLVALVALGECPADQVATGIAPGTLLDATELVRRTRLPLG